MIKKIDSSIEDESNKTKNDDAWEVYFATTGKILDGQSYEIKAEELKLITGREPRLLAKIDERRNLPRVLRKAKYSLLAITNGSYLIFKGDTFASIPQCSNRLEYIPKVDFNLETAHRGAGEMAYLDNAFNTGLISEFTNCGKLYLTIRGRERTKKFNFLIGESKIPVNVNGVQIEVDAGYEGENDIILVEGKIGNRKGFNIRQLYYPFRHFSELVPGKKIRTIFFTYDISKATYSLHEFGFRNLNVFDSIFSINCCIYALVKPTSYLINELRDKSFSTENNIIPQADDLNKIFELLTLINSGHNTVSEIADHFLFAERQSYYYGEAAESLGLITRQEGIFELTERGKQFISLEPQFQRDFILKLVVNSWYFQTLIRKASKNGYFTKSDVEELIISAKNKDGSQRYTESTIGRRVRTIISWAKWISNEFKSFQIEADKIILN